MLTAQRLKRILNLRPGEPPKVEALILYDNLACGLRVKHALDEWFGDVLGATGWGAHYRVNLWNFQVLQVPAIRAEAAHDAARSNLFCVAVTDSQPLGPEIAALVRLSLAHGGEQPRALILAGFAADELALQSSPAGIYLRMAARRAGTLFLAHPLAQLPLGPVDQPASSAGWHLLSLPVQAGPNGLGSAQMHAQAAVGGV